MVTANCVAMTILTYITVSENNQKSGHRLKTRHRSGVITILEL